MRNVACYPSHGKTQMTGGNWAKRENDGDLCHVIYHQNPGFLFTPGGMCTKTRGCLNVV